MVSIPVRTQFSPNYLPSASWIFNNLKKKKVG